jgi:type I restriction enzyme M protein
MSISTIVKSIQDIMRKDAGVDGDAQRLGQMAWLLFLRIFDEQEQDLEAESNDYQAALPPELRWGTWAATIITDPATGEEKQNPLTNDLLLKFVNDTLFPALKSLTATRTQNPRGYVVKKVMEDSREFVS